MRTALVSLAVLASLAPAVQAQTVAPPAASAPTSAPAPTAAAPAAPAASPPAAAAQTAAPAPEAPPPAPTDPAAIALLSTLESVCIPAANGGDLAKLAKAAGYRKSADNYVLKQPGFQFTILNPGSNPNKCHVDLVHPVYPEAPAKPMVIALHNWAAVTRGWQLYRNDKNVEVGQEFTTRSWEHNADGKYEAIVLTTVRKADGSPSQHGADTSMMIYNVSKSAG